MSTNNTGILTDAQCQQIDYLEQIAQEFTRDSKESFHVGKYDGMSELLLSFRVNDDGSISTQIQSELSGKIVISIIARPQVTDLVTGVRVGMALEDHFRSGDDSLNIKLQNNRY